ncbi:hypothetical protein Tco_0222057 [Tanacetum coccineum]
MTTTVAQQVALDNALVPPEKRVEIGKCNMRVNTEKTQKEPTYQVLLDALALTTCYSAFLITTNIYLRLLNQEFDALPSDEEIVTFLKELGHKGDIEFVTEVGMFYKKNVDFVKLLWEDFTFHIDNKDTKKQEKMYYPRFTKAIIHHFITKDKSISMRNRMFMHTAKDDSILGPMRFVSKADDFQVYRALIFEVMMNQKMRNSPAYKTYLAYATGAATPKKARKFKKPASPSKKRTLVIVEKEEPEPDKKVVPTKKSSKKQSTGVQI